MTRKIKIEQIVSLASNALKNNGLNDQDIVTVVSHLLDCELIGRSSHGFYRLPKIISAVQTHGISKKDITVENETTVIAMLNGGGRVGLVVAQKATETAIQKAKNSGIGVVGAYNYVGTTGAMGYYTREIANNNLIGVAVCNSEYAVAPWGGRDAILGTNPISISIPTGREPIVTDFATSAWSYGDLALAMKENRRIPEGIVLDKDGNPSTNPNDADNGCQLPMAGHKGYALGLAIEILAGPLVKAKAGKNAVSGSDGFFILVLNPSQFVPLSQFKSQVDLLIDEIKRSHLAPGAQEISIPGERSNRTRNQSQQSGIIEIMDSVLKEIESLAVKRN